MKQQKQAQKRMQQKLMWSKVHEYARLQSVAEKITYANKKKMEIIFQSSSKATFKPNRAQT